MSYDDWKKNFNQLEICNLGPDSLKDSSAPRKNFEGKTTKGEWIPRVSAGGCRNFPGKNVLLEMRSADTLPTCYDIFLFQTSIITTAECTYIQKWYKRSV